MKSGRTECEAPMLNLVMLGHYSTFIKLVNEEKNNSGDGLCQRFLMCAPHPLFGLKKKKKKESAKPKISILCILYAIEQIFSKDKIIFKFNNDAQEAYEIIADEYGTICELAHNIDGFIA